MYIRGIVYVDTCCRRKGQRTKGILVSLETSLKYFIAAGPSLSDINQSQKTTGASLQFTVYDPIAPKLPMEVTVDQFAFLGPAFKNGDTYPGFQAHVIFPDGIGVDVTGSYNTMTRRGTFEECGV